MCISGKGGPNPIPLGEKMILYYTAITDAVCECVCVRARARGQGKLCLKNVPKSVKYHEGRDLVIHRALINIMPSCTVEDASFCPEPRYCLVTTTSLHIFECGERSWRKKEEERGKSLSFSFWRMRISEEKE